MSSSINWQRLYLALAFISGIALTLGYKDVYPELEARFLRRKNRRRYSHDRLGAQQDVSRVHLSDVESGITDQSESVKRDTDGTPLIRDVKEGIEGCIGNTPLIRIKSLSDALGCDILAKAEFLNGAGNSPKDRVALSLIDNAEREGLLTPHSGDTIYEGTVGSTGISLATLARARGYLAHITLPSDQSLEKSSLLLRLGAVVEKVPPAPIVDANHFVNRARASALAHTNDPEKPGRGFFADQFETGYNWPAHYEGTGREIWRQTGGRVDAFVAGAGTGGTISGVARYLRERGRAEGCEIILADPPGSGLYNLITNGVLFSPFEREGTRRRHQTDTIIEGIGINRLTANLSAGLSHITSAVRVTDAQAKRMARWLVERDGIFIGSSSAVNVWASVKAVRERGWEGKGKVVVTILCDSGTRGLTRFWGDGEMAVGGAEGLSLEEVMAD